MGKQRCGVAVAAGLVVMFAASAAWAAEYTILVANKKTAAYDNAKARADGKAVFAERRLHKALKQVEELFGQDPEATVNVKIAHGEYTGKGGRAGFTLNEIQAPKGTLRILGGYDDEFKQRTPFDTPTILRCGAPAFTFKGRRHALKEFYLSGLMTDVSSTNRYDKKSNCLLKGSSSTTPIMKFGYLTYERFVIADCVFMNSSHIAAAPTLRAASDDAVVLIRNNFVVNNVYAWQVASANGKHMPKEYRLEGNSFIMNWPYNPDPSTANPAALEIGNKYVAHKVVIEKNLFAHNIGGAIYPTQDEDNGPPLAITGNLFYNNAALFGLKEPEQGAIVSKFGGFLSRKIPWNVLDIETVEDDFDWDVEDNVVLDPKVPIALVKPGIANSDDVEAEKTVENDVRRILGLNLQGGTVQVSNYAPRMAIDAKALPFPQEEKAKAYGVRRDRVEQF